MRAFEKKNMNKKYKINSKLARILKKKFEKSLEKNPDAVMSDTEVARLLHLIDEMLKQAKFFSTSSRKHLTKFFVALMVRLGVIKEVFIQSIHLTIKYNPPNFIIIRFISTHP
jgi:hypothetical protein